MKRFVGLSVAVAAGFVLSVAGTAWAGARSHHAHVSLDSSTMLAGTTLPAGSYTFAWKGSGPEVNVIVKQHGQTVTQAKAKLVNEGNRTRYQETVTRKQPSGTPILEELRLGGKSTALVFQGV